MPRLKVHGLQQVETSGYTSAMSPNNDPAYMPQLSAVDVSFGRIELQDHVARAGVADRWAHEAIVNLHMHSWTSDDPDRVYRPEFHRLFDYAHFTIGIRDFEAFDQATGYTDENRYLLRDFNDRVKGLGGQIYAVPEDLMLIILFCRFRPLLIKYGVDGVGFNPPIAQALTELVNEGRMSEV